ncbi:MAG: AraC family transcriptional regulator [Bacteroidales bacterium]
MTMQSQSRTEYLRRINRVIDYIDERLDENIPLEKLAEVACFSPFHFHRIWRAMTGETLHNFVKRIRLQNAGRMLLSDPARPVAEIATLCGFNSSAVFCRSFKTHYGMSTGEFRQHHGVWDRKMDQSTGKESQSWLPPPLYISDELLNQMRNVHMEKHIEVKTMPAMDLVYCRHTGAFDQIGGAFEKLMKWAGPRGLLRFPETKTVTVYHDDPKVTDPEKVRQSACITVEPGVRTEGEFGNMHVPGGTYVVGHFSIKPHQFTDAWDAVCLWLADSGYQPADGYPYEFYPEEHTQDIPPTFTVDICVPVKAL